MQARPVARHAGSAGRPCSAVQRQCQVHGAGDDVGETQQMPEPVDAVDELLVRYAVMAR